MLTRFIISFFIALLSFAPAHAGDVCAKADARYEEVKGDLPSDEGVTVVKLYKYTFCPQNLTVKAGTTIRFVNVDKRTSHSVWFRESNVDESERFFPDEYWEMPFLDKGTFPYLCGPHWEREGMKATLTVE